MSRTPARLDLSSLVTHVRSVADDPRQWRPHVRYDAAHRHWSRLPAPPGVDLWLLTWLPDQSTDLHDHGDAAAALTVLEGEVTEVRADARGTTSATRLPAGTTQWVAPGVVHDVVNRSARPAVSLHAYSPQLERMTFWRAEAGRLTPVRTVVTAEPEVAA